MSDQMICNFPSDYVCRYSVSRFNDYNKFKIGLFFIFFTAHPSHKMDSVACVYIVPCIFFIMEERGQPLHGFPEVVSECALSMI